MRCGFRPRDRDRTTERMEGVWMGFGPLWRGVGLQHTRGLFGSSVNRWSIKRSPMARNLTGGLPVAYQSRLANLGPIRERLTTTHEKRQKGTPEDVGVPECKTDSGENARMHETNTYANAMHMMT